MNGLTINECALIICILGVPDPYFSGGKIYPSPEQCLAYMRGGSYSELFRKDMAPCHHTAVQLSIFM